ncbi:MAG: PEP-CTERM sorting domain-containing protein [Burkholderiaceae bacterium]|nr:PEP-CTERM sorting domain-containing protein [Burkholderiaceae bacterium]
MRIWIAVVACLASAVSYAGVPVPPTPVPEPATLGLLAAAAVAGLAFGRNRRKK